MPRPSGPRSHKEPRLESSFTPPAAALRNSRGVRRGQVTRCLSATQIRVQTASSQAQRGFPPALEIKTTQMSRQMQPRAAMTDDPTTDFWTIVRPRSPEDAREQSVASAATCGRSRWEPRRRRRVDAAARGRSEFSTSASRTIRFRAAASPRLADGPTGAADTRTSPAQVSTRCCVSSSCYAAPAASSIGVS